VNINYQCGQLRHESADCPTGKSLADFQNPLSSPLRKNISVFPKPNHLYVLAIPPHRGALAIVIDAGRDAMDAAASGTRCDRFRRHMACDEWRCFRFRWSFGGRVPSPPKI
jgi:hypothetical protein